MERMNSSGARGAGTWRAALAAASGLLMFAAFPPLEWSVAAWVALIPLMWAVRGQSPRSAARLGFLSGCVFWLPSLYWVSCVTAIGWTMLAILCAVYWIFPAIALAWLQSDRWMERPIGRIAFLAAVALVWAGWEHLRGVLFTGFPWNNLGTSQHANLVFAQHAEWGGAAAVSALVAWGNATGLLMVRGFPVREGRRGVRPEVALGLLGLVAAAFWGWHALARLAPADASIRIALIQPAIPQYQKWTPEFTDTMYDRIRSLSRAAVAAGPHLVVWPETAIPEDVRESEAAIGMIESVVSNGVPLLVGGLDVERTDEGEVLFFNTSFLFGPGPAILETYDKQHRVLFGEYIPFSHLIPPLRRMIPSGFEVQPGRRSTVFRLAEPDTSFSVMICFEDAVAAISRRYVRDGARFIVVQTNDAWFDGTWGPRQHMIQSVFRAIETRVPVVRSANSGVTCWIHPSGRIGGGTGERAGSLPVTGPDGAPASGFLSAGIPFRAGGPAPTFYLRRGAVFGWFAAAMAVGMSGAGIVTRNRREPPTGDDS